MSIFAFQDAKVEGEVQVGNCGHVGEIRTYPWCQGVEGAPRVAPIPSWGIRIPKRDQFYPSDWETQE